MSKMADCHITKIEQLAAETGYSFNFLIAQYNACMLEVDGDAFGYFEGVTRERDW